MAERFSQTNTYLAQFFKGMFRLYATTLGHLCKWDRCNVVQCCLVFGLVARVAQCLPAFYGGLQLQTLFAHSVLEYLGCGTRRSHEQGPSQSSKLPFVVFSCLMLPSKAQRVATCRRCTSVKWDLCWLTKALIYFFAMLLSYLLWSSIKECNNFVHHFCSNMLQYATMCDARSKSSQGIPSEEEKKKWQCLF